MCHRKRVHRVLSVGLGGSGIAPSLAALASGLAKFLLQSLSFNEHILWISVAFLPLLAQPSKLGPVILLTAVHSFDQLKVDASPRLFNHHLEFPQEFISEEWQPLETVEIGEDILKGLVERVQRLVGAEFLWGVLHQHTPDCRI